MPAESTEVFISYAWGGDSEDFVNQLDKALQTKGITVVRDKRDLGYKGLIKEFMKRIGRGKRVISVISDKYLKSRNCMFELLEISKNGQFYDRIIPIILPDAKIYDPADRVDYVIHWDNEIKKLDSKLRLLTSSANLVNLQQSVTEYTEFRATIDLLTYMLQNMNALTPEIHSQSYFGELFESIEHNLSEPAQILETASSATLKNSLSSLVAEASTASGKITVQQFVNNQATLIDQFSFFAKQIGLESLRQDYAKSQFEAYSSTWKSLQALRLEGNELWKRANDNNLVKFAEQLKLTMQVVHECEIFFDELDYKKLFSVLNKFENFKLGKRRLIEISSKQDLERFRSEGSILHEHISNQINVNQTLKREYEQILDNIRISFRQKLSSQRHT